MSKLLDKLRAASKGEPARMGFGSSNKKRKAPGIGLIALIRTDAGIASEAAVVADAVLFESSVAPEASNQTKGVWGIDFSDGRSSGAAAGGADFIVISADSEIMALRAEDVSKVMRLDIAAPDSVLQAVGTLPVEAVLVGAPAKGVLKVADLLDYLRVGAMSRRPVLLPIAGDFIVEQLVAVRDVGIAAVCFAVNNAADLAKLQLMRGAIDEFPEPPRPDRNREGLMPSVPSVPAPQRHTHEDDEDDD